MSDLMDFLLDDETNDKSSFENKWNVLIVDDDPSIHEATKYVLSDFNFYDKKINWLDAYSSEEAKFIVHQNRDIALIFLDVVMDSDNAGLEFAKWFRESKVNPSTRIVLRTGQPGQAPEPQIIVNYDLHDYKTKTELSSGKLFTTTISALRAYHDMSRLESTRIGLENIINASAVLFQIQSLEEFSLNLLRQFKNVLQLEVNGLLSKYIKKEKKWEILASTFPEDYDIGFEKIQNIILSKEKNEENSLVKILYETSDEIFVLYFPDVGVLGDIQSKILEMLYANISIGLSNIVLYNELLKAHQSIVMSLAQITESRDSDTGQHVFRISKGTEILTKELYSRELYPDEIDEQLLEIIGLSSTLHDIGKISVPDSILLKPGKLSIEEFDVIKAHPSRGAQILQSVIDYNHSNLQYIELGKQIAMNHHERWDGTGYPNGLKGKQIPIAARITAIIDVFDALINTRCYKSALPLNTCLTIIKEGKSIFFDPKITDVFFDIFDKLYENIWKYTEAE